jgi:hypothetical protein
MKQSLPTRINLTLQEIRRYNIQGSVEEFMLVLGLLCKTPTECRAFGLEREATLTPIEDTLP